MRDLYRAEVRDFGYAFVMPAHGAGWRDHSLVPDPPETPEAGAAHPRRRAGDKQPVYIEIKPKA